MTEVHIGMLDDLDHEARLVQEKRIKALGAAISRRNWHAVEQAHAAIRDSALLPAQRGEGDDVERVARVKTNFPQPCRRDSRRGGG